MASIPISGLCRYDNSSLVSRIVCGEDVARPDTALPIWNWGWLVHLWDETGHLFDDHPGDIARAVGKGFPDLHPKDHLRARVLSEEGVLGINRGVAVHTEAVWFFEVDE